jgi:hypothetical protein
MGSDCHEVAYVYMHRGAENAKATSDLLAGAPELMAFAHHVAYRIATDPEVAWHFGALTQSHALLVDAMAKALDLPRDQVEKEQCAAIVKCRKGGRKTEHERFDDQTDGYIEQLREQRDELLASCKALLDGAWRHKLDHTELIDDDVKRRADAVPVKTTAWACQFKCGYRVQTVRSRMVKHEERCCHNPANRACATCRYLERDVEDCFYNDMEGYSQSYPIAVTYCAADEDDPADLEEFRRDCPLWAPKTEG